MDNRHLGEPDKIKSMKKEIELAKLTPKQEKFCKEYLLDLNATQAAIRAGYSPKTAAEQACRLLINVKVAAFLSKEKEIAASKTDISREMVLNAYKNLAFYDSRKFYNEDGSLKNVPELDNETAFALTGFEVNQIGEMLTTSKIKMQDRKSVLDSIAKMLGYNEAEKHTIETKQVIKIGGKEIEF